MRCRRRGSRRRTNSSRDDEISTTPSALSVAASRTVTADLILYSDLNSYGSVFGGRLVSLIDKTAAISARKHAGGSVVTAAIDSLVFERPATNGSIITICASVNRVFYTSMEVGAVVTSLAPDAEVEERICRAYLTFVSLDTKGRPTPIRAVVPESDEEARRFEQAAIRRTNRLALRQTIAAHTSSEPDDDR